MDAGKDGVDERGGRHRMRVRGHGRVNRSVSHRRSTGNVGVAHGVPLAIGNSRVGC
jgi:hypothetical protein